MTELGLRLLAFIAVGLLAWWLARKWPMADYGPQQVHPFDRWYLLIALLLAAAVDEGLGPILAATAHHIDLWTGSAMQQVAGWSVPAQVAAYLVATDFLGYWAHRWMHGRALWRVHAMHHSSRTLNWFSGMRGSPLHMVLVLAPGAMMASVFLLNQSPTAFWGLLMVEMASQHFTHSNIRVPFAKQLEWVLVTPRMHFVHHHREARYGNSNYGFYFSVWDHLFGTYLDADAVPRLGDLGLMEDYTMGSLFWGLKLQERSSSAPVHAARRQAD